MQTLPHLGKRGNVYQWRLRSRRQSTGIVDLKLSPGTTDLRTAHILSSMISAESDIVMVQLEGRQSEPQNARAWLSLVVRRAGLASDMRTRIVSCDIRDITLFSISGIGVITALIILLDMPETAALNDQ